MYDPRGGIAQVLNDVRANQFDTQIREKEEMPSIRLERLKQFSEMIKAGSLQLPPPIITKIVLELMDDPDLRDMVEEELGQFMKEQQAAAQAGGQPGAPAPMAAAM